MTHVTCRLTAKNRDQLRNSTLGNQVWATFFHSCPLGEWSIVMTVFFCLSVSVNHKCLTMLEQQTITKSTKAQ